MYQNIIVKEKSAEQWERRTEEAQKNLKTKDLTDFHLAFNASFTPVSVVKLSFVVIVHHFDKFT